MAVPGAPPALANLAPAVDTIRLSLHVLAATIWVGGQWTLAGLIPTARQVGEDAPKRIAQAFARLAWPAFAVLVITGVWNIQATKKGQPHAWQAVLGVKIVVVALSGVSAFMHSRATSRRGLAIWGALTGLSATAALVLGVLLAG